jgi:predicted NAD/FAD-dependent oxidoreductase
MTNETTPPTVRCLLLACQDAPGNEADLYAQLFNAHMADFRALLDQAMAAGLVRRHYDKLRLTARGRQIAECNMPSPTLAGRPGIRRTRG